MFLPRPIVGGHYFMQTSIVHCLTLKLKYMRRTAGYTWTDCKRNFKGVKNNTKFAQITGIQEKLDKICK